MSRIATTATTMSIAASTYRSDGRGQLEGGAGHKNSGATGRSHAREEPFTPPSFAGVSGAPRVDMSVSPNHAARRSPRLAAAASPYSRSFVIAEMDAQLKEKEDTIIELTGELQLLEQKCDELEAMNKALEAMKTALEVKCKGLGVSGYIDLLESTCTKLQAKCEKLEAKLAAAGPA